MATRRNQLLLVALLGVALQGCGSTPRFNARFGEAVHANLAAQVLDPAASSNVNPVNGIDGKAAVAAQEHYQRSFRDKEPGANQPLVGNTSR